MNKIPKIIIQFWHDKNTLPSVYQEAMAKNIGNNPGFQIIYADDRLVCDLLQKKFDPCLLALYQANKIPASRSDIARLVLLYEYGGIYMDASMELNASIHEFSDLATDIILLQRDDMPKYADHPEKAHVSNGMIGAAPKSKFIEWCINKIVKNLLSGEFNYEVRLSTGPIVLNEALDNVGDIAIKKWSFKALKSCFLKHIRVDGLANSWMPLQAAGIIDTGLLDELNRKYSGLTDR